MGLFDKFKRGLGKARDFISDQFSNIAASFGVFNEEELEDLEMLMIASDMGAQTTDKLMENLRSEMRTKGNKKSDFVLHTLKTSIREILGKKETLNLADDKLNIIIMVVVNRTGKTTAAGSVPCFCAINGVLLLFAQTSSCSMAAALKVSAAAITTLLPSSLNL